LASKKWHCDEVSGMSTKKDPQIPKSDQDYTKLILIFKKKNNVMKD